MGHPHDWLLWSAHGTHGLCCLSNCHDFQSTPATQTKGTYLVWAFSTEGGHCASLLQLSEEVKDMLNRIFKTDESQRISIAEIKEHPWFTAPLDAKYVKAQEKIDKMQGELDNYTAHRRIHNVSAHFFSDAKFSSYLVACFRRPLHSTQWTTGVCLPPKYLISWLYLVVTFPM